MISKYNGTCFYCHRPTKAGVDQYDLAEKISYHAQCLANVNEWDETVLKDDAESLADRLGYRKED